MRRIWLVLLALAFSLVVSAQPVYEVAGLTVEVGEEGYITVTNESQVGEGVFIN